MFSIHHNPCNYCYTTWKPYGYWCDWSCSTCTGCFVNGTKVILSDGSKLNIEEVELFRWAFDTDENMVSEGFFVGDVQEIEVETLIQIKFEDGLVIKTTL